MSAPGQTTRRAAARPSIRWWLIVAVLAGLVVGCTGQAAPPPTWSGPTVYIEVPTRTETVPAPPATSSPTPDQALYDQAVEVYHQFYAEQSKLTAAGGAETLPPEMATLLADTALMVISGLHRFAWENGYQYIGEPQFRLVWIRPDTSDLLDDSVISVETCEEITGAMIADGAGTPLDVTSENWYSYQASFRFDEHQRLVINHFLGEETESCA